MATNDLLDNTIDKLFASNHRSHEIRKQEPFLSRMPSESSTTKLTFSTISIIQSQNMVCDLNG